MNFFYLVQHSDGTKELLTAELDGTILPGVTRQSVIDIGREEFGLKVTERTLPMKEFIQFYNDKKVSKAYYLLSII
jgi:branched-chain amino acid aminotransferase